ncbi:transposase family protein [Asanoa sp. NPDC049573]|uniref:helix-turn-helix domain-containing protein n=1 Tax=Asanoa sp. NPDC049573 TaxID=3155396 RepID=UPI0034253733
MLSYPSTISLSSRTLNHLAGRIRGHRKQQRSRWRRLDPGRQALPALAHLRNGDTLARLAAGFEVGVATAWRYVQEAIDLLRAAADDMATAMQRIRRLAYTILDGTLILAKLRCRPRRATAIVLAILVLHHVEANRYAG